MGNLLGHQGVYLIFGTFFEVLITFDETNECIWMGYLGTSILYKEFGFLAEKLNMKAYAQSSVTPHFHCTYRVPSQCFPNDRTTIQASYLTLFDKRSKMCESLPPLFSGSAHLAHPSPSRRRPRQKSKRIVAFIDLFSRCPTK